MSLTPYLKIDGFEGNAEFDLNETEVVTGLYELSDLEYSVFSDITGASGSIEIDADITPVRVRFDAFTWDGLFGLQNSIAADTLHDITLYVVLDDFGSGDVVLKTYTFGQSRILDYSAPSDLTVSFVASTVEFTSTPLNPIGELDTDKSITFTTTADQDPGLFTGSPDFATNRDPDELSTVVVDLSPFAITNSTRTLNDPNAPLGFTTFKSAGPSSGNDGAGSQGHLSTAIIVDTASSGLLAAQFLTALGADKVISDFKMERTDGLPQEEIVTMLDAQLGGVTITQNGINKAIFDSRNMVTEIYQTDANGIVVKDSEGNPVVIESFTSIDPANEGGGTSIVAAGQSDLEVADRGDLTTDSSLAVFIKIDGFTGPDNIPTNGPTSSGWFELSGFDFSVFNPNIVVGNSGGQTLQFTDLVVDFATPTEHTGYILNRLVAEQNLGEVKIAVYNTSRPVPLDVETYTFKNATIEGYSFNSEMHDRVVFGYGSVEVASKELLNEGGTGATPAFDSNEITNGGLLDTVAVNWTGDLRALDESQYSMFLDVTSGSKKIGATENENFTGAMDVEAVQFHVDAGVTVERSTGAKPYEFSTLVVDFVSDEIGLLELRKASVSQSPLTAMELSLVPTGGSVPSNDLLPSKIVKIEEVFVASMTELTGDLVRVEFAYDTSKFTIETKTGSNDAFKFEDGATSTQSVIGDPDMPATIISKPEYVTAIGGQLTEVGNDSTTVAMTATFADVMTDVEVFSYELTTETELPFVSTAGGGPGTPNMSVLTFDIARGDPLNLNFLNKYLSGDTIETGSINIVFAEDDRGTPVRFTIVDLKKAVVVGYSEGLGEFTRVSVAFEEIKMESAGPDPETGDLVSLEILGPLSNVLSTQNSPKFSQDSDDVPSNLRPDTRGIIEDDGYLTLPGVEGTTVAAGFEKTIEIFDYEFDPSNRFTVNTPDGAKEFYTLELTLQNFEHASDLIAEDAFAGIQFPTAKLEFAQNFGNGPPELTQTLDMKNVVLLEQNVSLSGETTMVLGFSLLNISMVGFDERTGAPLTTVFEADVGTDDVVAGSSIDDVLEGGKGNDTLSGLAGDDSVYGGEGDDEIDAASGEGDDFYDGGDGDNDTITFRSSSQGVYVDLEFETSSGTEIGTDSIINIENVVGGSGSDTIYGDERNNTLDGGAGGPDTIYGLQGNDTFVASDHGSEYYGGDDIDTYDVANSAVSGLNMNIQLDGTDAFGNTISGIEIVLGGDGNDFIGGNGDSNSLYGGGGNDVLFAGYAPVTNALYGGTGNDTIQIANGVTAGQEYHGGDDYDTLQMFGSDFSQYFLTDHTVTGIEALLVQVGGASAFANISAGFSQIADLQNISLSGDQGGLLEASITFTADHENSVDLSGVTSSGLPQGSFLVRIDGNDDANEVRTFNERTVLYGYGGDDVLFGGAKGDAIDGGADDDTVYGGGGNDRIYGGAGSDSYFGGTGFDIMDLDIDFDQFGVVQRTADGLTFVNGGDVDFVANDIEQFEAASGELRSFADVAALDPNSAPTAVSLVNTITSLPDNTDTTSPVTVATIIVEDDGLGTNIIELSGADANLFEVTGVDLNLKAGAVLSGVNGDLDVTVTVTDAALGTALSVSDSLTIDVVVSNTPASGDLAISGEATVGNVLTVASTIDDADGLGDIYYEWFSSVRNGIVNTGPTHRVTDADLGGSFLVLASFVDGRGNFEQIVSNGTAVVVAPTFTFGTTGADIFEGTPDADYFDGAAGSDIISGDGNTDVLVGGADADIIFADDFQLRYALPEANQVFRLYQSTFNRTPDNFGHKYWAEQIFTGQTDLAGVREGFVGSREFRNKYDGLGDADFVKQLYINVLNRDFDLGEVSQADIDGWTDAMASGLTRADVVNGFSESRELVNSTRDAANALAVNSNPAAWSDDIFRLYRATLDRDPDAAGFGGWSEQLSGGRAFNEVIFGFTQSQEFRNTYGTLSDDADFVKLLYNNVLDRDFDLGEVTQGEIDGWTTQVSETFTRANIVAGFSQSREFTLNTADDLRDWAREQGVDDQIDGGSGTNILAGGTLADVFVFDQTDAGTHTVLDLEAWDYLSFEGFNYVVENDIRANLSQVATNVVFSDQGTTITFVGANLDLFTDDIFVDAFAGDLTS